MPTILHIIHGLTVGGAELDLLRKSTAMVRQHDYSVTVCCLMRRGELADRVENAGIRVLGPIMRHRYDVLASRALRRLLRSEPWSVVHTHIFAANLVGGLTLATLRANHRPPLIASEHAAAERWSPLVPLYYQWLQRLTATILVPSRSVAEGYIDRGVRERAIQIMPNGLKVERFEQVDHESASDRIRRTLGIPERGYIIGTVCRLERIKGVHVLVRAVRDLSVHLVVVGDGPERHSLAALAAESGLSENVHFLGTRSDVPDLLAAFDLFVLPSFSESFGIVVAEALLTRTPVVATRVGGIIDVTFEGEYAYLVPPGDVQALRRAISWAKEHPEEAKEQASRGSDYARETYSLDAIVERQHSMYQSYIGS